MTEREPLKLRKSDVAELEKAAAELRSAWKRIGRVLGPMADVGEVDGQMVDKLRSDVVGSASTVDGLPKRGTIVCVFS